MELIKYIYFLKIRKGSIHVSEIHYLFMCLWTFKIILRTWNIFNYTLSVQIYNNYHIDLRNILADVLVIPNYLYLSYSHSDSGKKINYLWFIKLRNKINIFNMMNKSYFFFKLKKLLLFNFQNFHFSPKKKVLYNIQKKTSNS